MSGFLDPSVLGDREAAEDAVLRFAESLDDGDFELFRSAFFEDCVVDMSGVSENVGVMNGRDAAAEKLIGNLGEMDTTHHISNMRVKFNGDSAELTCYVLAQHLRPGVGLKPSLDKPYMLRGNRYRAQLERDSDWWRIRHLVIKGVWVLGDVTLATAAR